MRSSPKPSCGQGESESSHPAALLTASVASSASMWHVLRGASQCSRCSASSRRPRRPPRPAIQACVATNARFRATDGVKLAGAVLGSGKTGIVVRAPGAGDRCQWLPFARELVGKGYRSLVFDMRGYGASAGVANVNPHLDVSRAAAGAPPARRAEDRARRRVDGRHGSRRPPRRGSGLPIAGVVELSAPTGFGGVDARRGCAHADTSCAVRRRPRRRRLRRRPRVRSTALLRRRTRSS